MPDTSFNIVVLVCTYCLYVSRGIIPRCASGYDFSNLLIKSKLKNFIPGYIENYVCAWANETLNAVQLHTTIGVTAANCSKFLTRTGLKMIYYKYD
jgi:hypothetical protein